MLGVVGMERLRKGKREMVAVAKWRSWLWWLEGSRDRGKMVVVAVELAVVVQTAEEGLLCFVFFSHSLSFFFWLNLCAVYIGVDFGLWFWFG